MSGYDSSAQITFLDLINGIAQIATALAFILAYVQFRKNRIQQRQAIIAKEAECSGQTVTVNVAGLAWLHTEEGISFINNVVLPFLERII